MKQPTPCACPFHQKGAANGYADYVKDDPKLARRVRRDALANARRWRLRAETETDPKEKHWLEITSTCAEWSAWICLRILRGTL